MRKGAIVLEYYIASVLMLIALALIINFIHINVISFNTAQNNALLQDELRKQAGYITDKIRSAKEIHLQAAPGSSSGLNYVYLENGRLVCLQNGTIQKSSTDITISELNFVSERTVRGLLLHFIIEGQIGQQKYTLNSSVLAERLESTPGAGENGTVLAYR